MRRPHGIAAFVQTELKAALSFVPLIGLSLLIVLALTRVSVTLAYPYFQSPESPLNTPTTAPPTPTSAPPTPTAAAPTATTAPGAPTPTTMPAAPSPELPTPTAPPIETPGVPISPTIAMETETPTVEPEVTVAEGAPPEETASAAAGEEEQSSSPIDRVALFIDSCVLGFSYLWLCCGGLILVLFVLGVVASFLLRRA